MRVVRPLAALTALVLIAALIYASPSAANGPPAVSGHVSVSPPGGAGTDFGIAVAIDGDIMAVANTDDEVHVFRSVAGVWTETQVLTGPTGEFFGRTIDLDGGTLVISAPGRPEPGRGGGAVDVYEDQSGTFVLSQELTHPGLWAAEGDMGTAISLSGDHLLVGASYEEVIVFERVGGTWNQIQRIPGFAPGKLGTIAVAVDGDRAVLGQAPAISSLAGEAAAYSFNGGSWTQTSELGFALDGGQFGSSVAIDGTWALVTAPNQYWTGGTTALGEVLAYDLTGPTAQPTMTLLAPPDRTSEGFASSISVAAGVAIIGSEDRASGGGSRSGAAYLYQLDAGGWHRFGGPIEPLAPVENEQKGARVATDGTRAVLGASSAVATDVDVVDIDMTTPAVGSADRTHLPTSGGSQVVLSGIALGSATGALVDAVPVPLTVDNDSQVTITAPPHAEGPAAVVVQTALGDTAPFDIDYDDAAEIDHLDDRSGPRTAGQVIHLTGEGFTDATDVLFTDISAQSFVVDSDRHITVTTPELPPRLSVIRVDRAGQLSPKNAFVHGWRSWRVPDVDALSPTSLDAVTGGTVTVTGTDLLDTYKAQVDGADVPFVVDSDTQVTIEAPPHPAAGVEVTIVGYDGFYGIPSPSQPPDTTLTYVDFPPIVDFINPVAGSQFGETTVAITGSGLADATAVDFGGTSATFVVDSDTQLTATTPPGDPGSADLVITATTGSTTVDDAFVYMPPGQSFVDVPITHQFWLDIEWMAWAGLTLGWPDDTWRPASTATRQAAIVFLWRQAGSPTGSPDPGYSDVAPGYIFFDAIAWATNTGLSTGWPDNTWRPTDRVTRQAMARWLHLDSIL